MPWRWRSRRTDPDQLNSVQFRANDSVSKKGGQHKEGRNRDCGIWGRSGLCSLLPMCCPNRQFSLFQFSIDNTRPSLFLKARLYSARQLGGTRSLKTFPLRSSNRLLRCRARRRSTNSSRLKTKPPSMAARTHILPAEATHAQPPEACCAGSKACPPQGHASCQ